LVCHATDRVERSQCYHRVNIRDGVLMQSGIGDLGQKHLYHFATFPIPLWAKYCTTLWKVLYHLGPSCYRFARKHGSFSIRRRETMLHMWYVPQFCDTIVRLIFDQICLETILVKNDGIEPKKDTNRNDPCSCLRESKRVVAVDS
jgi:hypothetical protein